MNAREDASPDPREVWLLMSDLVLDHNRRREVSDALGISFARARAVRRLARRPMSMGELAAALGIDPPNASTMVNDLESQGLVRRTQHPTDRRAKVVEATRKGKDLARRADTILATPPPALSALGQDDLRGAQPDHRDRQGGELRVSMPSMPQIDRTRVLRTLTFWLRPAFVLRAVNRFQRIAGFDRAVALASSALTALIPLAIVAGAILSDDGKDAAERIIDRYDLTGGGAEAVKDVFSPPTGAETDVSLMGALLLVVAVLSFTRAVQRLFEQTWELKPLSVRNTFNGLLWIAGLALYLAVSGWVHGVLDQTRLQIGASVVLLPVEGVFLVWSGWILTAKRISRRDLLPFGVVGAILLSVYSTGASVYVPHLFSSYATRYGVIGAVFAMISALFCVMLVLVAAAALGREVQDELERIRRGETPPDDEIRKEWDALIAEGLTRWSILREQIERRRGKSAPPEP